MSSEVISGLFAIGAAAIAFFGGIIAAKIGERRKEREKQIKDLKENVLQLANEVISYSKVENELLNELKEWRGDYKKDLKSECYRKIFGDSNKVLMNERTAQGIINKI